MPASIRVGCIHRKKQQDMERGDYRKQPAGDSAEQKEAEYHAQDVEEV